MSTPDQFFSDTIVRFQQWIQFLERKQNEYQMQLNRVQRKQQPAHDVEPTTSPAPEPVSAPANPDNEDAWL